MSVILDRLSKRFRLLAEQQEDQASDQWKDPNSPGYDRQTAEDALFHTVGPLTDTPVWGNDNWSSPGRPVPGFKPGGPAPRWTEYEVVMAYAGDPSLLFKSKDHPHSPLYGNKGGAPLFRMAKRVARHYARTNDRSFIEDLYGNGMIALVRVMKPGYDAGAKGFTKKDGTVERTPFISFAARTVQSAMEHGVGGNVQASRAAGEDSTMGASGQKAKEGEVALRGMASLLKDTNPASVRQAAEIVQGKYRETRSHDKTPENPFGPFSASYYQTAMAYADALESEDADQIERAQSRMRQLIGEVEDSEIQIRGASSGLGQAISTPDRVKKFPKYIKPEDDPDWSGIENDPDYKKKLHPQGGQFVNPPLGVQSMDVAQDDGTSAAGNITTDDNSDSLIDPESVQYVLDIAINYDLGKLLKSSDKYNQMALAGDADGKNKAKIDKKTGRAKIGGPMTAQELRYIIRKMGPLGSNYPGKGKPRANTQAPRDAKNWWQPGEDPEIEPIPGGDGLWHSIWSRSGYDPMQPTAIADEMTAEVKEFVKLGIESARADKVMNGEMALSKVAASNTATKALIKLKLISHIHRYELGMDESVVKHLPILEGMSKLDRSIIAETCDWMISKLSDIPAPQKPISGLSIDHESVDLLRKMRPVNTID